MRLNRRLECRSRPLAEIGGGAGALSHSCCSSFLLSFTIATLLLTSLFVSAQQGVGVSPPHTTLFIAPGSFKSAKITVFARKTPNLIIEPAIYDWQLTADGRLVLLQPGSSPFSASHWIKLRLSPFELSPQKDLEVPYTISLPPSARGSYRTALAFSTQVPSPRKSGVHINLRVVALIYVVTIGGINPDASIANAVLNDGALLVDVINQGNVFLRLRPRVEILNAKGEVINTVEYPEDVLLRGGLRRLKLKLPSKALNQGVLARVHITAQKPVPLTNELYAEVALR